MEGDGTFVDENGNRYELSPEESPDFVCGLCAFDHGSWNCHNSQPCWNNKLKPDAKYRYWVNVDNITEINHEFLLDLTRSGIVWNKDR